jgi:hypothetical protein
MRINRNSSVYWDWLNTTEKQRVRSFFLLYTDRHMQCIVNRQEPIRDLPDRINLSNGGKSERITEVEVRPEYDSNT